MSPSSWTPAVVARCAGAVAIAATLVVATARWTDLSSEVDRNFFFATGSGTLEQVAEIERLFERHTQLVVIAAAPNIAAGVYRSRVAALEEELLQLDGVVASQSVASGPSDLEDARASPLWRRLLLAGDESATCLPSAEFGPNRGLA